MTGSLVEANSLKEQFFNSWIGAVDNVLTLGKNNAGMVSYISLNPKLILIIPVQVAGL